MESIDDVTQKKITAMICPRGHHVPCERWNYARDFDGGQDAMTLQPTFESGLYCHSCEKAYGLSKLREE